MLFLDYIPDLNDIDISIYKYVVTNMDDLQTMTVRELSEKTHTSTASIIRFCKKFDCDGFSEFKVRLRLFQKEARKPKLGSTDVTMLIEFLNRTTSPQFENVIDKAANILKDKELLIFIGEGPSGNVAEYGAHYFSLFFGMTTFIQDVNNHYIQNLSENLSKNTGLIVLSVSGETKDIIKYAQNTKYKDSCIVSITNNASSTLAKLSDANISYFINQDSIPNHDRTSQVPALYCIELLAKKIKELLVSE